MNSTFNQSSYYFLSTTKMPFRDQITIEQARERVECWSLNYQEIIQLGGLESYVNEYKEVRPRIRWYLYQVYQSAYKAWSQFPQLERPKNVF